MQVNCAEHAVEEEDYDPQQLDEELNKAKQSVLHANLNEQNEKSVNLNDMQLLREKIDGTANPGVQRLISIMKLLKDLEREDSNFQFNMNAKQSELQDEVIMLEESILSGCNNISGGLDNSFNDALEKLNSAKRELAARLREILFLKKQIDDVPSQTELIQYEHRFSELYAHIQGKHRKTRTYYATYNALLEKKELMLKETSLLNSISSQFQEAFSTIVGRTKLVDSMEGIVKGTQLKLEKVQLTLQTEQRACDALKERYAASALEQKHCSSLLKAFQEECTRNERLRSTSSP